MDNGLDANLDAAGRLGGIQVAKLEEQGSGRFHDFLCRRVSRLVHATLVAGKADYASNPWATRCHFRSPHDFVRVAAVRRSPHIRDVERALYPSHPDVLSRMRVLHVARGSWAIGTVWVFRWSEEVNG